MSHCPAGLSALSVALPALTSVLIDITFLFQHSCTLGPGLRQGVTSIHPATSLQPQIGEIPTQRHREVLFVRINSVHLQCLEIVCCSTSLGVYRLVCFSTIASASNWTLGENWFFHSREQTGATHIHYWWSTTFYLLIYTANNTVICHEGFVSHYILTQLQDNSIVLVYSSQNSYNKCNKGAL